MGDAIAVSLLACKDFSEEDFARFHPGGILGKRLNIKVQDLISDYTPKVNPNASINDVIIEISQNRLGVTAVLNDKKLAGIITDGDLRRHMGNGILEKKTSYIMTKNPKTVEQDIFAFDALDIMKKNKITQTSETRYSNKSNSKSVVIFSYSTIDRFIGCTFLSHTSCIFLLVRNESTY